MGRFHGFSRLVEQLSQFLMSASRGRRCTVLRGCALRLLALPQVTD
jgi:hypothetical protein